MRTPEPDQRHPDFNSALPRLQIVFSSHVANSRFSLVNLCEHGPMGALEIVVRKQTSLLAR